MLAASLATAQKTPDAMLGAAIHQEEVQGDLKGAVAAYQKVAATAGISRKTAAEALVRMGQCYEKLGDVESRRAYERVVREFGDQKESAALARTRLGRGPSNKSAGLVTREVWTGSKVDIHGSVSPDGRLLSFSDWSTGDLAVHDFTTGQDRRLTDKGTWEKSQDFALFSVISRDGKQVAYQWGSSSWELRVIDINGGKPRTLVASKPGVEILPMDWSPDGKWIAVRLLVDFKTNQIALVSAVDGTIRVLKSSDWKQDLKIAFSPDGKQLACDLGANGQREIHLLRVDGSGETPLSSQPANERILSWSLDGKRLFFASDRSGISGIWATAITGGKPQGAPEMVKANVKPSPIGMTRSGALYYSVLASGQDINVAQVDFETGKLLSAPTPVKHAYLGLNDYPQWSHDGKQLAYLSHNDANDKSSRFPVLSIRSAETGKVRELSPNLNSLIGLLLWSPDGSNLVVNGKDNAMQFGIYRVDAQSGNATPLLMSDQDQTVFALAWSVDGRTLYIRRFNNKTKSATLIARGMQSGNEREILRRDGLGGVAISPDGRQLAVTVFDRNPGPGSLLVYPIEGGEPRELLRITSTSTERLGTFVQWSPDGKYIYFRKGPNNDRETHRISANGGPAVKFGTEWTGRPPAIHPDGKQVAFSIGEAKVEIWALENLLSGLTAKK